MQYQNAHMRLEMSANAMHKMMTPCTCSWSNILLLFFHGSFLYMYYTIYTHNSKAVNFPGLGRIN